MTWWTASSLTAIVAHDAATVASGSMTDRTGGGNNASLNGQLVGATYNAWPNFLTAVNGTGSNVGYTTAVTLPASGTAFAMLRVKSKVLLWNKDSASQFMCAVDLAQGVGGLIYTGSVPVGANLNGAANSSIVSLGVSWAPGYLQHHLNGAFIGTAFTSALPLTTTTGITYGSGWSLNSDLLAFGLFNGRAAASDLTSLDTAVRAEMPVIIGKASTNDGSGVTDHSTSPMKDVLTLDGSGRTVNAQSAPGVLKRAYTEPESFTHTQLYGGNGVITGTVYKDFSGTLVPAYSRLLLIDEFTRLVVRESLSNATTGRYTFDALDVKRPFTVLAYDMAGNFVSVAANYRFATPV